jgi:hypothetical protein
MRHHEKPLLWTDVQSTRNSIGLDLIMFVRIVFAKNSCHNFDNKISGKTPFGSDIQLHNPLEI